MYLNDIKIIIREELHNILFENDEEKELEKELAGLDKELEKELSKIAKDVEAKAEDEKAVDKALKEFPELKEFINRKFKLIEINERRNGRKDVINEEAILLGVSMALAIPGIVTIVGKITDWTIKKLGGKSEVGEKIKHFGEHLHHMLIGSIEKGISFLPGIKSLPKDKQEKIAEAILVVIVASLAVTSGVGAITALKDANLTLTGIEAALTAVKGGEVGTYLSNVIKSII